MLVTKTNPVKNQSGVYFYTYIPTEVASKLGLKLGNEYLMWNLMGSKVEIVGFPLEQAKKILESRSTLQHSTRKVFIKNKQSTELDLF